LQDHFLFFHCYFIFILIHVALFVQGRESEYLTLSPLLFLQFFSSPVRNCVCLHSLRPPLKLQKEEASLQRQLSPAVLSGGRRRRRQRHAQRHASDPGEGSDSPSYALSQSLPTISHLHMQLQMMQHQDASHPLPQHYHSQHANPSGRSSYSPHTGHSQHHHHPQQQTQKRHHSEGCSLDDLSPVRRSASAALYPGSSDPIIMPSPRSPFKLVQRFVPTYYLIFISFI
jgi:hypothetical protein